MPAEPATTLATLSELVRVSVANLSVLENDRARAIRFSTLTAICQVLQCSGGDLFSVDPPSSMTGAQSFAQAGR
ncbi:helix-turn-helix domain-containing protein [Rhodococcus sp. NPDC049939]|uniref:helix-turn-helix domain-containing protein n=1 Tax=Rhodococcus sp. NPDC049939 TaxID=3155511 RepID=UPI0033F6A942